MSSELIYPTSNPPKKIMGTDAERLAYDTTKLPPFSKWYIDTTLQTYVWNGSVWNGPF